MKTNFRTVKRYLGKALLTGVAAIGMAATNFEQPALLSSRIEGCVVGEDWWDSNIGLYNVSVRVDNSTLGTTDVLGNFSIERMLLEGTIERKTLLFQKEGYHDYDTPETFVAGRIVTIPENIVMRKINSTK